MEWKKNFMHQKMMTQVLLAMMPLYLLAVFFYGWRVLVMLTVVVVAAVFSEFAIGYLISRDKFKVSEAVLVTAGLYTLTLPAATPIYIAVIGIVFGVVFGKMAFGGFGRNIFNPALVARCFIYIGFPTHLTMRWMEPFLRLPGGFSVLQSGVDAISAATPLIAMEAGEQAPALWDLLWGGTSGSMGETSILLIVIAGLLLVFKKTASWKIMVSVLLGAAGSSAIFTLLGLSHLPFLAGMFTGGLFFMAVFMATDPVTAPKDETAKWIVGVLIGVLTIVIRNFSLFPEGAMFAVLIGNAFTPLIERHVKSFRAHRKARRDHRVPIEEGK